MSMTLGSGVEDYWTTREVIADGMSSFYEIIETISDTQAFKSMPDTPVDYAPSEYLWRGVASASWGLHSSISLRHQSATGTWADEEALSAFEANLVRLAKNWALDWHGTGGLTSSIDMLVRLQHHGAPTRLLDFTYNPFIALWFAVRDSANDDTDGRIFACDVSRTPEIVASHSESLFPWSTPSDPLNNSAVAESAVYILRPKPLDDRIVRQSGVFITGPAPSAPNLREFASIEMDFAPYHNALGTYYRKSRGPSNFTIKIPHQQKPALRRALGRLHNLSNRTLFPDLSAFSEFAKTLTPDQAMDVPSRVEKDFF